MGLSPELISQFAKVVNNDKKQNTESTIYGTVVDQHGRKPGDIDANGNEIVIDEEGGKYIKPDGSDQLIPITENDDDIVKGSTTTNTNYGDRASVLIKNHTATVTGNVSAPSASNKDIETKINEYDVIIAKQIQADKAYLQKLIADEATIGQLEAAGISVTELLADSATIQDLIAGKITVTDLIANKIDADVVIADSAIIEHLKASTIDVLSLIADKAVIEDLIANEADLNSVEAKNAYLKYATVDFSNIGEAAISKLFTESGIIEDLVVSEGKITGELVGVTIKGDLIEAGTLKADRLVVKGSDGNYYALSTDFTAMPGVTPVEEDSIHGSVLVKKSIVAEKIAVDDLVAFGATIGGFHITGNSIYSGSKESIDNTTRGIYMDTVGQFAVGDDNNYIKYGKDEKGSYKLDISSVAKLENEVNTLSSDLADFSNETLKELSNLQDQIDGSITTWFYSYAPASDNEPASLWPTTDQKNQHLGDLFYDLETGYCYRWQVSNQEYSWQLVKDADVTKALEDAAKAQDTADSKRRVFTSTPTPPYEEGDLWAEGSSGDLYRCVKTRLTGSFYSSDWELATKYTDDTAVNDLRIGGRNLLRYTEKLPVTYDLETGLSTYGASIKPATVTRPIVSLSDVSPFEHNLEVKLKSRNIFDADTVLPSLIPSNTGSDWYWTKQEDGSFRSGNVGFLHGSVWFENTNGYEGQMALSITSKTPNITESQTGLHVSFDYTDGTSAAIKCTGSQDYITQTLVSDPNKTVQRIRQSYNYGTPVWIKDIMIAYGTDTTYIPYNITDSYSVKSKNLFDISKFASTSSGSYINNGDGTITVTSYGVSSDTKIKDICPNLKVGDTAVLSCVNDSIINGMYLHTYGGYWDFGKALTITEDILNSDIILYCRRVDGINTPATFSNIQVELGTTATEYEPYKVGYSGVTVSQTSKNFFDADTVLPSLVNPSYPNYHWGKQEDGSFYIFNVGLLHNCVWFENTSGYTGQMAISITGRVYTPVENATGLTLSFVYTDNTTDSLRMPCSEEYVTKTLISNPNKTVAHIRQSYSTLAGVFIKDIMLSYGTNAEYEPYNPYTVTANADGTVEGLVSRSPNTTLYTDSNDVVIECTYNQYTGEYVFEETDEGLKYTVPAKGQHGMSIPLSADGIIQNGENITLSFDYRGTLTNIGKTYLLQRTSPNVSFSNFIAPTVSETEWQHYSYTFYSNTANDRICYALLLFYHNAGQCTDEWIEIKKGSLKLEKGEKATDWNPAPEDTASADDLNSAIDGVNRTIIEHLATLNTNADSIVASVSSLEKTVNTSLDGINTDISELRKEVNLKVTDESVDIAIQKAITDGVNKVDTGTGIKFDIDGMTVNKIDDEGKPVGETNTRITENGMTVNNNTDGKPVLTANKDGVDAKDLHATTYLIVGKGKGRSRFEDYGERRTGCFWIGE